jgi:hypothetical protein
MSTVALFEEKQGRRAWNAAEEKWYFAIVDVIAILTGSENPPVYWRVMQKRLIDERRHTSSARFPKIKQPSGIPRAEFWKRGREVECSRLLIGQTCLGSRGFESLRFRSSLEDSYLG